MLGREGRESMQSAVTKAGVDVSHSLVHGHVYETSSQAVMGEDEQHGL